MGSNIEQVFYYYKEQSLILQGRDRDYLENK